MKYGIDMKISQILEDPEATAIIERYLPGVLSRAGGKEAGDLSVRMIAGYLPAGLLKENTLSDMDQDLKELGEKRGGMSPSLKKRIEEYRILEEKREKEETRILPENMGKENGDDGSAAVRYDSVRPGEVWLDTGGRRIEAHAGGFLYENGFYYWYGENKEFTDGKSHIWTWGIRMYRSEDFYNWEDIGLIAKPDIDDPDSALFPEKNLDRPHIVRRPSDGRYIMWVKISGNEGCFAVLESDKITGPYMIVEQDIYPFGLHVGDFDIAVGDESGKAYIYAETEHSEVTGFSLDDSLTKITQVISHSYRGLKPPFCREGVTVFQRGSRLWMLTSGMTGYIPNQSDCASADDFNEEFISVGDPFEGDDSNSSFNSQISQVFSVPGKKDLYLAVADRWVPDYKVDRKRADMFRRAVASNYDPEHYQATEEEKKQMREAPSLGSADTHLATYVILPIFFREGRPVITWKDSWKLEDFADE